ncbi:MAG TPA: class A beta-lactamase-related serine hydrolase [Flavobacteriaceae bacterium]|nr:class A beta-lactamase-related serine hydrolase [Flavobacteriaceae bacterium]
MKILNILTFIVILTFVSCKNEKSIDTSTDINTIENGLLPSIKAEGDSIKKYNILERMEHYNVPGVSIAIVENGEVKWAKGYGMANTESKTEVNTNTIFQAGSISKPLAALAALKLVEEDSLNLDQDISEYLKDWQIPESEFTKDEKVTLRRLLTHTAGMTVHGFPGYKQTDTFPTIIEVLDGKGNTPQIFVDTIPGSIWRYSGGGYTLMEKLVEDISKKPLDKYMAEEFLTPIGMNNSTYEQPLGTKYHSNASAAYNSKGELIKGLWNNYPEQAAAGLWTTPTDLAKYCIEIQKILSGKNDGILSKKTIDQMLTKHKNNWGLGPSLQWKNDSLIFRHGGKNEGFTNEFISFANKGNAVIVMTNADNGGKLIGEILRSVSNYYAWGINNQRVVKTIELPLSKLDNLVGKYKLAVTGNIFLDGDYIVEIAVDDKKIIVTDPNNGETNVLTALEELKFIDLDTGDEAMFQLTENKQGVLFNNRFQFYKIQK